jgi:hypothetical protein
MEEFASMTLMVENTMKIIEQKYLARVVEKDAEGEL